MKTPTLKQKVNHYETFLHKINMFCISGNNEGIKELVENADNWSYSHRCGEFVTDNQRQKMINGTFWKLLDTPKADKATQERQAKEALLWSDIQDKREMQRERDEARRESLEQARLLGISGEWGCKLIAERDEARAITKEAITGLYNLGDYDLANKLSGKLEEPK